LIKPTLIEDELRKINNDYLDLETIPYLQKETNKRRENLRGRN